MLIGLDFDGVISDAGKLKREGAKILYGLDIPPEKFKTEIVVGQGILTLEQYRRLQRQIYGTRDIGLLMEPVPGVFEYTQKLKEEGHKIKIVTSRGDIESGIAREWMANKGLDLHLTGIGGGISKANACRGMDVYTDDDLDKLEPLLGIVPNLFFFSQGYNLHIAVPEKIKRVNSWEDLYFKIKELQ